MTGRMWLWLLLGGLVTAYGSWAVVRISAREQPNLTGVWRLVPVLSNETRSTDGEWKDGQLVVSRETGPHGYRSDRYALVDGGRTLVVRTRRLDESRQVDETRRVYHKVSHAFANDQ